ncbi:hypothetical protein D3C78_1586210 [compost metagenome]
MQGLVRRGLEQVISTQLLTDGNFQGREAFHTDFLAKLDDGRLADPRIFSKLGRRHAQDGFRVIKDIFSDFLLVFGQAWQQPGDFVQD